MVMAVVAVGGKILLILVREIACFFCAFCVYKMWNNCKFFFGCNNEWEKCILNKYVFFCVKLRGERCVVISGKNT